MPPFDPAAFAGALGIPGGSTGSLFLNAQGGLRTMDGYNRRLARLQAREARRQARPHKYGGVNKRVRPRDRDPDAEGYRAAPEGGWPTPGSRRDQDQGQQQPAPPPGRDRYHPDEPGPPWKSITMGPGLSPAPPPPAPPAMPQGAPGPAVPPAGPPPAMPVFPGGTVPAPGQPIPMPVPSPGTPLPPANPEVPRVGMPGGYPPGWGNTIPEAPIPGAQAPPVPMPMVPPSVIAQLLGHKPTGGGG